MKEFWKAALIRALRTFCQTAVATVGTAVVLKDVDWMMLASASALSAILSILTSIATGLPEAPVNKAPITDYEQDQLTK